ncbi:armadillo repeat-containing protein 8-like isoform X3 [Photinus pyralis]|uniref:armadillo repeat-containing protein 8-like isoform X3 n=1 Tax=Photinus pyralis TaxID=7054 RepID=UPI0012672F72|nr:armadillo repeat-containing protein 8-like isoform X3 [Photinus pyralis]
MLSDVRPFMTFMDVEHSRSYIDDLYSSDPDKCLTSLICIKNSVIGSNRQKESVIAQGIVPRLIQLLKDRNRKAAIRLESVVTIGSLAKGTGEHVELLINCGTVPLLLDLLEENDPLLIDACLCCLRTLSQQDTGRFQTVYSHRHLQKLLSFAEPEENILRQSCVASILSSLCKGASEQNALRLAGAAQVLTNMLSICHTAVRVPTLTCLAAMAFENRAVAEEITNTSYKDTKVITILARLLSRDKPIDMQLEAARCLTNLHRAGAIMAYDAVITFRTLPCLVRLCQIEHSTPHRAAAANTLAYLTEVDSELQQTTAISNQLIGALADSLLNSNNVLARQAAFRAFASLGANDEDIRKRIIETNRLMERVVDGLGDPNEGVRLAAIRCLHSLSRSVQQLRTTFQDHSVWRPLMALLTGSPPLELLSAASSTLCNLLLEFSPAKEPMLQQGAVQLLATLTTRNEPALRLNGVWALMNLAFQAEQRVKSQILTALGTDQIFRLLADSDTRILMKTLGLLRNLVSPRAHTDAMMTLHGPQVMQAVVLVLEGPHSPDVKEQALCILTNIADGERAKDHIMANDDVLKKLTDYMTHPSTRLQIAAIYCITNLIRQEEPGAAERQLRLREMGVVNILNQLSTTPDNLLYEGKNGAGAFSRILSHCCKSDP